MTGTWSCVWRAVDSFKSWKWAARYTLRESASIHNRAIKIPTLQSKFRRHWPPSLRISNQSQYNAETWRCEEALVFNVCNLPDLLVDPSISILSTTAHSQEFTSPSVSGGSFVRSGKNLRATSPVTTPRLSVSAAENTRANSRRSSGLRLRLGCSEVATSC